MLIKRGIRSGQHASPRTLKVFSVKGMCGTTVVGQCAVPIFSWMGYISPFGLALCGFSVFQRYLMVMEVKCLFVEELFESDFSLSKRSVGLL